MGVSFSKTCSDKNKMRILYIFRSLATWGGIERILIDKMNYLVAMYNYKVYMLTSDQGDHPIPFLLDERVHLEDLRIRFHQKYQYHGLKRLIVAKRLKYLYEKRLSMKLGQIHPDVIVCTTADHIDSIVKLKGSVPLVVESHSICKRTIERERCWLLRKWYRTKFLMTLSHADVIVALTERDAVEWRKVHHNVLVIPNMVNLNRGPLSTLDNKRVIFVGRFDYQKRPLEMIRIWKILNLLYPDWQLDIYGEGEQQLELEEMVSSLGMNIVVHAPTNHIFDCYRESSILVSTSLFEPFGLVIPEAMSCGLPVVAYDCPYGPSCLIENGKNGFLIEQNNISNFVDRVCMLMHDIELRRRIGKEAVLSSQKYNALNVMPLWNQLFEQLLSE